MTEESREGIAEELEIIRKDMAIDVGSAAYPSITFRFLVNSKADVDLEADRLVAYVHIASQESPALGKVNWSSTEESLNINSVANIEAKGSGWVTIRFAPPFSAFKSDYAHQWTLKGILFFLSGKGEVRKNFSLDFRVDRDEIKRVLEQYASLE